MKVNVASKNPVKIEAVREVLRDYTEFSMCNVVGVETDSGVNEQPNSLEETVQGAINRAASVYRDCSCSFGIESGLMKVPNTKTGSMNFCVCAIYDGENNHLGLSCAFEFPIKVTKMVHSQGVDINEAFYLSGLTKEKKIGSAIGAIGLLTRGRISRKDYTKQAVQMALIHLENRELY
jgi:inosine/xanthosine triphosphatase